MTAEPKSVRLNWIGLVFGAAFGFVLGAARLHEYDTIHRMLRFDEPDVFLLMGSSISTSLPLLWWLERRRTNTLLAGPLRLSRSKPQRHHVVGGGLFGIGWAVAGTCPAPALVMLTSGAWLAVVTIAGMFIGIGLRDRHTDQRETNLMVVGDGEHHPVLTGS